MKVIDNHTGQLVDLDDARAKRGIRYGTLTEAEPEGAEMAAEWRDTMRQSVIDGIEDKFNKPGFRYPEQLREFTEARIAFEDWCGENGLRAWPATAEIVTWHLLDRVANGSLEPQHASRLAFVLGCCHEMTNYPPRTLGKTAYDAYSRALVFAARKLRDEVHEIAKHPHLAPGRALELFPAGAVPRSWNDVAA